MLYEILTWGHDDPTAAHFGTTKTYEKMTRKIGTTTFTPSYLHIEFLHKRLLATALSIFSMVENPRLPPDVSLLPLDNVSSSVAEHRSRIVNQLEAAQAIARTNIQRAQQQMKAQYEKARFQVGRHVWVFTPKPRKGLSKKLCHMWSGSFRICTQLSPVHYQL